MANTLRKLLLYTLCFFNWHILNIADAVKKHPLTKASTRDEVAKSVAKWLRGSRDRVVEEPREPELAHENWIE